MDKVLYLKLSEQQDQPEEVKKLSVIHCDQEWIGYQVTEEQSSIILTKLLKDGFVAHLVDNHC